MTELALHILDIANNSIRAEAKHVTVSVTADTRADRLTISVSDDGCGMSEELLGRVTDPFATTRTTRKVGLGLPLLKQAAEVTGGGITIRSKVGEGTTTEAVFGLSHIDRMPMGDLASTMRVLICGAPSTDFVLRYEVDGRRYDFDTAEVRSVMDGVPLDEPEVASYIEEMLRENIETINGGVYI